MRPFVSFLIVVSIGLGLGPWPSPCWAGLAEGVAAYKQEDFATALHELLPLAEHGDAAAQFYLGTMYLKGWGVPQDVAAAAQWSRRAATQGVAAAQYNLGMLYVRGEGVPPDLVEAYKWLQLAVTGFPAGGNHDKAVQGRDAVAAQLTPEQLAQAQELASQWHLQQEH